MNLSKIENQSKEFLANVEGPPLHLWHPELSGEIDIIIKKNGDWFHEGTVFKRKSLVKLFASILHLLLLKTFLYIGCFFNLSTNLRKSMCF